MRAGRTRQSPRGPGTRTKPTYCPVAGQSPTHYGSGSVDGSLQSSSPTISARVQTWLALPASWPNDTAGFSKKVGNLAAARMVRLCCST